MPISSKRNSVWWVPINDGREIKIGDRVRVKELSDILPLLNYDRLYYYGPKFGFGQNFISFNNEMEKFCGNTYEVTNKEGDFLIQLDTDIKNGKGEGYWFHYVFLEYAS